MNNLTRYDPIDDLFRGLFVRPVDLGPSPASPAIKMDVKEQENAFLVHAELPGVKKDDIHVTIDGNLVAIVAEIKQEKEIKEGERVLRSERYFGKLSRSFQLAHEVDDNLSSAKFNDGILELILPKRTASTSKRLSIQ